MKKLLFLLFIPLVFTCSSDSSDDDSNQTFLERYADIVWESNEEEDFYISFNLNGYTRISENCLVYIWGIENPDTGLTWNLLENNYENFIINLEENGIIDFTATIGISEDENTLIEYLNGEEIYSGNRTSLSNPCE
tara:strand:+ start:1027 stop:1434 length:408 start_codon:yes stop_codon:yes gene_type:complete